MAANPRGRSDEIQSQRAPNYAEGAGSVARATRTTARIQKRTGNSSKCRRTESTYAAATVARTDGSHVRGRRGHLRRMTEIPLDTLHEIFRELEPVDLLHLSWANKSLRSVVMEKTARYIWQEVRTQSPYVLNVAEYY